MACPAGTRKALYLGEHKSGHSKGGVPVDANVRGEVDAFPGQGVRYPPLYLALVCRKCQLGCVQSACKRRHNQHLWNWVQLQCLTSCILCLPDPLWGQLRVVSATVKRDYAQTYYKQPCVICSVAKGSENLVIGDCCVLQLHDKRCAEEAALRTYRRGSWNPSEPKALCPRYTFISV